MGDFKVGDRVVFQFPRNVYQSYDMDKVGTVTGMELERGTVLLLVVYDDTRFAKKRRAKSFRHLTPLEKAMK